VYQIRNYERNYSETKSDQANAIPAITGPEVIPRINPKLFRERKKLEFIMEALLFAIIVGISTWPILAAADEQVSPAHRRVVTESATSSARDRSRLCWNRRRALASKGYNEARTQ
jgi:hypothetical protein